MIRRERRDGGEGEERGLRKGAERGYRDSSLVTRARKRAGYCNRVCPYIYMCTKKIVIEQTRDLIYLKFVATDFFPKIISPSAGENSNDLA